MSKNLIRTSIIVCIAWSMPGCQTLIDHTEETELTISVDSMGNSAIHQTTRNSTEVNVVCDGEVDIAVDRRDWVQNVNIKKR